MQMLFDLRWSYNPINPLYVVHIISRKCIYRGQVGVRARYASKRTRVQTPNTHIKAREYKCNCIPSMGMGWDRDRQLAVPAS